MLFRSVDQTAVQAKHIGLVIPDADLKWNEARGHYDFGGIDWDEFNRVVAGHGPCNRERLAARRAAHADGEWVREAMLAHADKQRARATGAAA